MWIRIRNTDCELQYWVVHYCKLSQYCSVLYRQHSTHVNIGFAFIRFFQGCRMGKCTFHKLTMQISKYLYYSIQIFMLTVFFLYFTQDKFICTYSSSIVPVLRIAANTFSSKEKRCGAGFP
jgi:hypothetical protein